MTFMRFQALIPAMSDTRSASCSSSAQVILAPARLPRQCGSAHGAGPRRPRRRASMSCGPGSKSAKGRSNMTRASAGLSRMNVRRAAIVCCRRFVRHQPGPLARGGVRAAGIPRRIRPGSGRLCRCRRSRQVIVRLSFEVTASLAAGGGQTAVSELPCCSGDGGGDDVGRVPIEAGACPVVAHGGARVGVGGGLLHITQRDPASRAAVMNACLSVCGLTFFVIPARRVTRRTIRAACRRGCPRRR